MLSGKNGSGSLYHLFVVGPPSVGKGFGGGKITENRIDIYSIITGKMIGCRMERDPKFKNDWEQVVVRGDPVSDGVLSPMVYTKYISGVTNRFNKFLWDGWGRNPDQARDFLRRFASHGERVTVVNIQADETTCRRRYYERNMREKRIDGGAFDTRWGHYIRNIEEVLAVFNGDNRVKVINIDGNVELEEIASQSLLAWQELTGERIRDGKMDVEPKSVYSDLHPTNTLQPA